MKRQDVSCSRKRGRISITTWHVLVGRAFTLSRITPSYYPSICGPTAIVVPLNRWCQLIWPLPGFIRKIRHHMSSSGRDAFEGQPAGYHILQPASQLESSIRCECFKTSCMATWQRTRSAQSQRQDNGQRYYRILLTAIPSLHPPRLPNAEPSGPQISISSDLQMIDSRLQHRAVTGTDPNVVQRCEGCLAATDIANNG